MKQTIYRNKEQRQKEVLPVIRKLTELGLTTKYDAIKELYIKMKEYINNQERIKIKINFPEVKKQIVGILAIGINEKTWIKLQNI